MRSTITVAVAALLVVLAGYGIADAASVTLTIQLDASQLSADGLNGPTSTTYTVYAQVTDNTTTDGFMNLAGGLSQFMVDQTYTVGGVITEGLIGHRPAAGPPSQTNALTVIQAPFTALTAPGKVQTGAWVADRNGTGGVDNTFGAKALVGDKFDYYNDAAPYQLGNGSPVALFTGTIDAKISTDATVTVNVLGQAGQILVYKINESGLYTAVPEEIIGGSAVIHLGPTVATNEPPTAPTVSPTEILETDWQINGGHTWNNPLHSVAVSASGSTDDGNPVPPGALTYEWFLTGGGKTDAAVGTGATLNLTIADLIAAGFTLPDIPGAIWQLTAKAYDGELYSTGTTINFFVPEPATIGMLSFGLFGALLRRRRRA